MDLHTIYLETRPEHIAYIKFIFESYEELGIIRTVDRKQAIIVLLAVTDFVEVAQNVLESLKREISLTEIPQPHDVTDDWLMSELVAEASETA